MKKLTLLFGIASILIGISSCSEKLGEVDENSIIGEWGILDYNYFEDRVVNNHHYNSMSKISDPYAKLSSLIFNPDGSGKTVCYGYYEDLEHYEFVDYYLSFPFKWDLNGGALVLNYTGDNPRSVFFGERPEGWMCIPIGTEYKAGLAGNKLKLLENVKTDTLRVSSTMLLTKK